ncbi:MAG: molybdenum cofactor guanylyltransferase [Bacteroidota bacterium]
MTDQSPTISEQQRLGAIVMANGPADKLACKLGAPHKALLDIGGRTMIGRVVDALKSSPQISDIVVGCRAGGPVAESLRGQVDLAEGEAPSFLDGITAGFEAMPDVSRALLVTCDMPLLSPEAVDAIVNEAAAQPDVDLLYAMVDVRLTREAYPEGRRTAIRLKEGNFTAAGVCVVSRRFIEQCGPILMEAFKQRKSKIGMARLFGIGFLAKFALGVLSVEGLVKRAEEMMGCKCAAVSLPFAECGFDVDSERDLAAARACVCRLEG